MKENKEKKEKKEKKDILVSCIYGIIEEIDDTKVMMRARVNDKLIPLNYSLFNFIPKNGYPVILQTFKRVENGLEYMRVIEDENFNRDLFESRNIEMTNNESFENLDGVLSRNKALRSVYTKYKNKHVNNKFNKNSSTVKTYRCVDGSDDEVTSPVYSKVTRDGNPVKNSVDDKINYAKSVCSRIESADIDPQLKQDILREFRKNTGLNYVNMPVSREGVPVTELNSAKKRLQDRKKVYGRPDHYFNKDPQLKQDILREFRKITESDNASSGNVSEEAEPDQKETVTAFTKTSDPEWFDNWPESEDNTKEERHFTEKLDQFSEQEKCFSESFAHFLGERRKFMDSMNGLNSTYERYNIPKIKVTVG